MTKSLIDTTLACLIALGYAENTEDISAGDLLSRNESGNQIDRTTVLHDDKDRRYFGNVVKEYKEICGAKVYHWVWMDTHFHI